MLKIIDADNISEWSNVLKRFDNYDVCQIAAYHDLYSGRVAGSQPVLFVYENNNETFCYPFLLTPVVLTGNDRQISQTDYNDITGIYGYSGPLSTTSENQFLQDAWKAMDHWSREKQVIAEFCRYSVFSDSHKFAHPDSKVLLNRPCAISRLPNDHEVYLSQLPSKTRNLIGRAQREGFTAKEMDLKADLQDFRVLYEKTMTRNQATQFFLYDDIYFDKLKDFPEGVVRLFGVYKDTELVACAMGLSNDTMAYYHLGASDRKFTALGTGNLAMYEMASCYIKSGIQFLNVGGGRTQAKDDALFRFKKNNATDVIDFYIGTRVLDVEAYKELSTMWKEMNPDKELSAKVIFYREY